MTIRGVCPECGLSADLAAFVSQGEHNQALAAALEIPAPLGARVIRYLGLFRPPSRALASAKAARLLGELRDAIGTGRIDRRGVSRPAPVAVWAAALDQILERPPSQLPLTGHNYLLQIVAGVADTTDARAEQQREQTARSGQPAARPPAESVSRVIERSTDDVLEQHRRLASRAPATSQSTTTPRTNGPRTLADLLKSAPGAQEDK